MVFLIQIKEKKMKKNFLMVASLLIAAMLMVVSCTQEVKAPESNLVEVKLGVGYGRDLTVSGDTKTEDMVLKYTMQHNWADTNATETVVGDKTSQTEFTDDTAIGYVTPGLWTVHVYAYEKGKSSSPYNPIFEGEAQAYFSDKKNKVTVYLAPTSGQTNTIRFAVSMQDLVGDVTGAYKGAGDYKLKYTLQRTNGDESSEKEIPEVSGSKPLPNEIELNVGANVTRYYVAESDLASGYYRATVKVYSVDKNGSDSLVGGISKGFLLSGGNTATLVGHIEPNEYVNFVIDAVLVDVNTALSVGDTKENVTVAYNSSGTSVDVKWTDSTGDVDNFVEKNTYWSLNGGTFEHKALASDKPKELTVNYNFTKPGYNFVTVTTVYKVKAPTTGNAAAEYFYADTQTIRIFVNPETSSSNQ